MSRFFTHYWTNETWKYNRTDGDEHTLRHTASNLFAARGVQSGDHVYVITVIKGQLYLLGKMVVSVIGDVQTIATLLECTPDDLWHAQDHLFAIEATTMHFDRQVPLAITEALQFHSGGASKGLFFKKPGILDGQTLRGVRELTEAAAQMLDSLLPPLRLIIPDEPDRLLGVDEPSADDHGVPGHDDERTETMTTNGSGMSPNLQAYHQSIDDELTSIRNRIRHLIGDAHWLTDGEHKEAIVRRVLRNHMPESIRVGTGFVCYADGTASNQLDILLTDTRKPTLFKDDELVMVTADAVRAVIEVKTKLSKTTLRDTLTKLGENAEKIRNHAPLSSCLVGLFVHDAGTLNGEAVLETLYDAAKQQPKRVVDFVAVGSDIFVQYSDRAFIAKGGEPPLWYLYGINKLAPAYFISHFVWRSTDERDQTMRFAWFPLEGAIRQKTHAWISLHTKKIRKTDLTFVP